MSHCRLLFQAIEDFNNGQIQFVVRDYGIVLMNRDQAEKNGFMPLSEFAKEKSQTAAADDPWERPRTSSRPNAPPAGAPKPTDAAKDNPFGESKPVNKDRGRWQSVQMIRIAGVSFANALCEPNGTSIVRNQQRKQRVLHIHDVAAVDTVCRRYALSGLQKISLPCFPGRCPGLT